MQMHFRPSSAAALRAGASGLTLAAWAIAASPAAALPMAVYGATGVDGVTGSLDGPFGGTLQFASNFAFANDPGSTYSGTFAATGPVPRLELDYQVSYVSQGGALRSPAVSANYYFEVQATTAAPLTSVVPLDLPVQGAIAVQQTGETSITLTALIELSRLGAVGSQTLFRRRACDRSAAQGTCPAGEGLFETFDENVTFFVEPDRTYHVQMLLFASSFGGPGTASAEGYLDPLPVLSDLDPTLLGLPAGYRFADEFAISFSDNIGNIAAPTAVPAPRSAWLLGFAAALLGLRRPLSFSTRQGV